MRSRYGLTATLIISLLGWASVRPGAQAPAVQAVSPFDIVGFIDAATVDDAADVFSGGTITVDGTKFVVPRNTLLQMPAFALTWQEVFDKAPQPYKLLHQTGLARADTPVPYTTYEVHMMGNRVVSGGTDQMIVGLMFLSMQSLNSGAGFLNYIDYATGDLYVGGALTNPATPNTGVRIRQNDPIGRHGIPLSSDVRFQQDEDNPTVRTETGYPTCVPRQNPFNTDGTVNPATDDPLCPQKNRPKGTDGNYLTIFTMDPPDFGQPPANPETVCDHRLSNPSAPRCDPNQMMPLEVGDFLDYNATGIVTDAKGQYMEAWGIISNIGAYTAPGTQPVYTAIDVMILGVAGIPNAQLPQRATVRTRIEGMTTDPTSFMDLFAVDVDACTGAATWRYYDTVAVDHGPPIGAVAGRWRWRPNSLEARWLPPSRMLLAVSENGIVDAPVANGTFAGMYIAPNFDFLTPEPRAIGDPPVPNNFNEFPFLADGSGPYPAPPSTQILGPLSPWPGGVTPTPPVCTPTGAVHSPVADAGVHQSVTPGTPVTLNATASRDTNTVPLPLSFSWRQTGGIRVDLTNPLTANPSFVAPPAPAPLTLEFTVDVSNGFLTSSALVTVTVAQVAIPTDRVTITSAIFRIRRSRLDVNASTSDPAAVLTLVGFGDMGPALPVAFGVPSPVTDRLYTQLGVNPQPEVVTVRSSLGGTATLVVTVVP